MIRYYLIFFWFLSFSSIKGQKFLDFVQTIRPDSFSAALEKNQSSIDELKTSITLLKGSQFNTHYNGSQLFSGETLVSSKEFM